jgi:hypothetical protein
MYIQLPELESAILSDVHSEALKGRRVTDANEQGNATNNYAKNHPQSAPTRTPNPMRTGV